MTGGPVIAGPGWVCSDVATVFSGVGAARRVAVARWQQQPVHVPAPQAVRRRCWLAAAGRLRQARPGRHNQGHDGRDRQGGGGAVHLADRGAILQAERPAGGRTQGDAHGQLAGSAHTGISLREIVPYTLTGRLDQLVQRGGHLPAARGRELAEDTRKLLLPPRRGLADQMLPGGGELQGHHAAMTGVAAPGDVAKWSAGQRAGSPWRRPGRAPGLPERTGPAPDRQGPRASGTAAGSPRRQGHPGCATRRPPAPAWPPAAPLPSPVPAPAEPGPSLSMSPSTDIVETNTCHPQDRSSGAGTGGRSRGGTARAGQMTAATAPAGVRQVPPGSDGGDSHERHRGPGDDFR